MKHIRYFLFLALLLQMLCGCAVQQPRDALCTVLFEDCQDIRFRSQVFDVPRGQDLTVTVSIPAGQRIACVSYPGSLVSPCTLESADRREYQITLPNIRYPAVVRMELMPDLTTVYTCSDGEPITVTKTSPRLRVNTLPWQPAFARSGRYPLGWRMAETGQIIGFGSRFDHSEIQQVHMDCEYIPCTPPDAFDCIIQEGGAVITGYHGAGDIVIPDNLGDLPVIGIAGGAFGSIETDILALPHTLQFIRPGAFASLKAEHIYLFDSLLEISDAAFGTLTLSQLHIQAATPPAYCGTYFDTLSEKTDYLASVAELPKILLFCGSSARFGYDSTMLAAAFPGYNVVNMGVYAYSNMLPQAMLLESYLHPGDIVLSSPELDAIDMQFCGSPRLDSEFFAMMESNYDMLTNLDLSRLEGIFDALGTYLQTRRTMQPRSYLDIPAHFDEDGRPCTTLSYNRQGDYILHRPSNEDRKLFGVKRAFYNTSHIREEDWQGLNRIYEGFQAQGARVFFTYSPRSEHSISPDSNADTIQALGEAFHTRLSVPVISDIQDSLMDAFYFYGTDNHLTTQGAELHTQAVIEALQQALEVTP